MNILVYGLSCTNLSGRQVLCGHLGEMLQAFPDKHRFSLLLHNRNRDVLEMIATDFDGKRPEYLRIIRAPAWTSHWAGRVLYDFMWLPRLINRNKYDIILTLSGTYLRRLPCRQYTLALNPWAFIASAHRTLGERIKAGLQRKAYARVVHFATGVGYGSGFMRDLYRRAAGREERKGAVVYPAFSRNEVAEMEATLAHAPRREANTVVCVSLMARHKNIESLIRALVVLRNKYGCPARLRLVGGWADAGYRNEIEALINSCGMQAHVELTGHVSRQELLRSCAAAKIYALLSRSESFGIPAVEAQWMGTPVVAGNGCAAPEVCAGGGMYVAPDDVDGAAKALATLLQDENKWSEYSRNAAKNARRFQYALTSRTLFDLMDL